MTGDNWIEVGRTDSIDMEDLIRFDHGDRSFCVYRFVVGFYDSDCFCYLVSAILRLVTLFL